jgi:large subunit ribosomal protein L25
MAEAVELKVQTRARIGKSGARAVRRDGLVPGIIYGGKDEPQPIALEKKEVSKQIQTGHFQSTIFMLDMDGTNVRVIPRDVQLDPVRDFPVHVDFMRLAKDAQIDVDVPVYFRNETASPGLKRGGVLNIVRHEISVNCPADQIPESFEIDLTGMDIGDSIHISSITLPEGVVPSITDRDFTIATIVGRLAEEAEAEEAEAEGETGEESEEPAEESSEGGDEDQEKE